MENHEILDSESFENKEQVKLPLVDLRVRSVAFILDYTLLTIVIYYSNQLVKFLIPNIFDQFIYIIASFYMILFVLMEHKYDGSIFKRLLKIKNISMDEEKLGFHIFVFKLFLRPIAFLIALIYFKLCFAILLWLFGIHKPLLKFLNGDFFVLWYDYTIKQMTIKMK